MISFLFVGGLWHSELITKNLITAYVPFLPLERRHVNQCIRQALLEQGYFRSAAEIPEDKVQLIADHLTFVPDNVQVFSITGCKRVVEKIDYELHDEL